MEICKFLSFSTLVDCNLYLNENLIFEVNTTLAIWGIKNGAFLLDEAVWLRNRNVWE